jgi:hypothetical protein
MHEIIVSEMHMDVDGMIVIKTWSVTEEGRDKIRGNIVIG